MAKQRTTRSDAKARAPKVQDPTLVLLVRHGQTPTTGSVLPGRASGLHLADSGTAQAQVVAASIGTLHDAALAKANGRPRSRSNGKATRGASKPGIAAVYASPMERTQETARPIARALGLRTRTRQGLIECDFGAWTGEKLSKLAKLPEWKTVQRHPSGFKFPNGESFAEMQARMVGAINELVAAHPGEAIVIVSHADTIKAAVAQALGTPLDLFQRIVIGPCSVSAIAYGPTGPTVLAVNRTDDLAAVAPLPRMSS